MPSELSQELGLLYEKHNGSYREGLRKYLLERLDVPMVSSYRFTFGNIIHRDSELYVNSFTGDSDVGYPVFVNDYIVGTGVGMRAYFRFVEAGGKPYYIHTPTHINPSGLMPEILILVKAKRLNYIRACMYLHQKMTLNVDEVRILYSNQRNTPACSNIQSTIYGDIVKLDIIPENVDVSVLLEFLGLKVKIKSKEEFLEDAKAALDHPGMDLLIT